MFEGRSIKLQALTCGVVELCFDRDGSGINKLDVSTIVELDAATAMLYAHHDLTGVLVTSAKSSFIVGTDIFEFPKMFTWPEPDIARHIAAQNAVFTRFEDLPVPIATAINGVALGGGLEQALASDYRVMANSAQLGFPEVTLGLIPGFGGTVRLPRLAGAAIAIDWITGGTRRSASQALSDGVVDGVVPPEQLRDASLKLLGEAITSGAWRSRRDRRHGTFATDATLFEQAKRRLAKQAVWRPAALAAVELLESCASCARDQALDREHATFTRISRTQAASALVQVFINEQRIKSAAKSHAMHGRQVRRVAVLGAGIMGGGIAYSAAARGAFVLMKDIAPLALENGMGEARRQLDRQVQAGRMEANQAATVLATIRPQLDYSDFDKLDLVVEAIVEKADVKRAVLRQVEAHVSADTIVASNTSSLSITGIARTLTRPENFVGMHFFNPVPAMPLVEIIRGSSTSPIATATAAAYAVTLGKTPVLVEDCPGFLVNRILTAYLHGYFLALRDGADYLVADRAMENFGWPMGPAYLQDVIGLDTLLHIIEIITAGYPERMRIDYPIAPQLLVRRQRLGQKNCHGYYQYQPDAAGKPKKYADAEVAGIIGAVKSAESRPFDQGQILERLMLPMIIEAALCLEQGIAQTPEEIDFALVLGLGFPRHVGGPLKYADWLGLSRIIERCDAFADLGPLYAPSERMRDMAQRHESFFVGNGG